MLKLVGRYELQERIGEGAMADVYRAYDPSINRVLAIKVLKGEFRQNAECAARFLREAKAAGALSHPNIVTIYDVGEADGYPYIVMEMLEGEPLDQVIAQGRSLPADDVMSIGVQLGEALHYAHGQGVIHRDIKPSNIVVGKDGRTIKILDFGIARVTEADSLRFEAETLKTQVGQVIGTPRYMSPEQALGGEIDGRSDLFSVGVVLYELATGCKAFSASNAGALALQIAQQDPAPIDALAPDTPRGLQYIVEKLLAKRADRRFADGAQLAEALRRELSAYGAVLDEAETRGRALPLQLRVTLVMATITALVLFFSVGGVLKRQDQAMQRMALTSGTAITSFVASNASLRAVENAALPPGERDWLPVEAFIAAASSDPNVQQLTVVDADGVIRAATDPAEVGQYYRAPTAEQVVETDGDLKVTRTHDAKGAEGFRFVRPITYAGRAFGLVDVSVSKAELTEAARLSRLLLIGLGLVTLGAVIAVSFTMARLLTLPIRRLKAALADAADGDLDFRISHQRKDEFGELFDGFNRFAASMQERLEAAEARTRELPLDAPARSIAPRRSATAAAHDPFAAPDDDLDSTRLDSARLDSGPQAALAASR
ncbi:MAG: protein kinase domain-containing protein [Phenylobacterium sp.]|uniref:serine/threonine-protein kinase n=1 Tax=Phenylobacterium sp. TaxID=1871053 RepID=UPI00391910BB